MKDEGRRMKAEKSGTIDLRTRTKGFGLRVIKVYTALDKRNQVQQVIGRQLLRSGTSVGAQYREACRARSDAEFISKMNSGLQELDETAYWFELLIDSQSIADAKLRPLLQEADELIAIFITCVKNTQSR